MAQINLGETQAPENKEKLYLKPGFKKLTVKEFTYEKEEKGKTPLIVMHCEGLDSNNNPLTFQENLYISGKLNKNNVPSAVVRIQELVVGLTNAKITDSLDAYEYVKEDYETKEQATYTIPDPEQLTKLLNKRCAGKSAIFKIGGQENEDGQVYTSLTYSGFLYFTDLQGELCKYTKERDFTESEYKYAVTKRKQNNLVTNNSIIDTKTLDDL